MWDQTPIDHWQRYANAPNTLGYAIFLFEKKDKGRRDSCTYFDALTLANNFEECLAFKWIAYND